MRLVSNKDYERENVHGHYFLDVTVANVRCFGKKQTLRLANERGRPYRWTILLGENGTGKTSLLKSIVGIAPSPKNIFRGRQELRLYPGLADWESLWDTRRKNGERPSTFKACIVAGRSFKRLVKGGELCLEVERSLGSPSINHSADTYERLGDFLCFGYGASRRMGTSALTSDKYATASVSLFDDDAPLINVEEFFLQADYEAKTSKSRPATLQRERVRKLLVDILPEVRDLRISRSTSPTRQVEALTPFGWVRISEMSLGYKSLIAWVVDFASRMYHYHRTKADPFSEPAVVLIDEVDLHLHPRWQRKILTYLGRKFPNTQFIASAHSPLIVQAALDANLVLLKRRGSHVVIQNEPEVVRSWRLDQIVTSDIFGVSSARSPGTEKLLVKRRRLLTKPKLGKREKESLQAIDEKLDRIPVAETPEYRQAMEIIQSAAAKVK